MRRRRLGRHAARRVTIKNNFALPSGHAAGPGRQSEKSAESGRLRAPARLRLRAPHELAARVDRATEPVSADVVIPFTLQSPRAAADALAFPS